MRNKLTYFKKHAIEEFKAAKRADIFIFVNCHFAHDSLVLDDKSRYLYIAKLLLHVPVMVTIHLTWTYTMGKYAQATFSFLFFFFKREKKRLSTEAFSFNMKRIILTEQATSQLYVWVWKNYSSSRYSWHPKKSHPA